MGIWALCPVGPLTLAETTRLISQIISWSERPNLKDSTSTDNTTSGAREQTMMGYNNETAHSFLIEKIWSHWMATSTQATIWSLGSTYMQLREPLRNVIKFEYTPGIWASRTLSGSGDSHLSGFQSRASSPQMDLFRFEEMSDTTRVELRGIGIS